MPDPLDLLAKATSGGEAGDADQTITKDSPCLGCGYNVRGLSVAGACPECGTPTAMSVHGDRLRYAHPVWMKRLRRGLIAMSMSVVLFCSTYWLLLGMIPIVTKDPVLGMTIAAAGAVALSTWFALGAFWLTTPEPRFHFEEDPVNIRRFVRACSVVAGLAVPAMLISVISDVFDIDMPLPFHHAARWSLFSIPALLYGTLVYLRPLARRIPDQALVTSTTIVMYGLPISATAVMLQTFEAIEGAIEISIIAMSIFGVWTCGVIWLYARALDEPTQQSFRFAHREMEEK